MKSTVLKNSALARLFAAQLLSQLGDKLMLVGIIWVISERFSSEWVPWFVAASSLPHLLSLSLAAPGIARLGGPLRTVVLTDLIRGVAFVVGAALVARFEGLALLGALFGLSLGSNCLAALFNPAILSLPPRLARGDAALLQKSTALIESCFSISAVIAPLFSTLLYKWTGLGGLLLINGLSYLVAGWLEAGIRLPEDESGAAASAAGEAVSSWQVMKEEPALIRMLMGFFCMNLFLGPVLAFMPLFAHDIYGGTINTLAWLEGAMGAGTALGALALAVLPLRGSPRTKVTISIGMIAVAYVAFALSRNAMSGVAAVGLLGLFLAVANVVLLNLFQSRPRPEAVPAVMGWVSFISVASLPISMTLVGVVLKWVPLVAVAQGCSVVLALLAVLAAVSGISLKNT